MSSPPDISTIIPCYGRASMLGAAVESVLNQTGIAAHQIEVIVVDDGSPDDVPGAVDRIGSSRVRLVRQANGGPSSARNAGLRAATGRYVHFLDSDDLVRDQAYASVLRGCGDAESGQDDPVLLTNYELWTPEAGTNSYTPTLTPQLPTDLLSFLLKVAPNLPIHCYYTPRSILQQSGLFDESLTWWEDYDLWLRVALQGPRIVVVNEPFALYRQHNESLSADRSGMTNGLLQVWEKHCDGLAGDPKTAKLLARSVIHERCRLWVERGDKAHRTRCQRLLHRLPALTLAARARAYLASMLFHLTPDGASKWLRDALPKPAVRSLEKLLFGQSVTWEDRPSVPPST